MNATLDQAIARVRLLEASDHQIVVGLAGTQYRLHLLVDQPIGQEIGKRLTGQIRCSVWKVDFVNAGGGSFIEPIYGRPRRVQGPVVHKLTDINALVIDCCGCPVVGLLPERWKAAEIQIGTRVGLDVHDGARFEPATVA